MILEFIETFLVIGSFVYASFKLYEIRRDDVRRWCLEAVRHGCHSAASIHTFVWRTAGAGPISKRSMRLALRELVDDASIQVHESPEGNVYTLHSRR